MINPDFFSDSEPNDNTINSTSDSIQILNETMPSGSFSNKNAIYMDFNDIKNMKHEAILCINARSLDDKNEHLNSMLNDVDHNFDLILLTEVWGDVLDNKIDHFEKKFTNLRKNRRGGGVAIFAKHKLKPKLFKELSIMKKEIESIGIITGKNRIVLCIYRPPLRRNEEYEIFFNEFEKLLKTCRDKYPRWDIDLCGDFNLNLLDRNSNQTTRFLNIATTNGLFLGINRPTRFSDNDSCLDNILSTDGHTANYYICPESLSDHCFIFKSIESNDIEEKKFMDIRKYTEEKILLFKEDLNSSNWDNIYNEIDDNKKWDNFFSRIDHLHEKHFPKKRVKIQKRKPDEPWKSAEILRDIKKENILYKKRIRLKTIQAISNHNEFKNNLKLKIRKAKEEYYDKFFSETQDDSKKAWNKLNSLIGNKKSNKEEISEIKLKNGIITSNKKDIANAFGEFFSTVPKTLKNNLNIDRNEQQNYLDQVEQKANNFNNKFSFKNVTLAEIIKLGRSVKNKRSSGPDSIPTFISRIVVLTIPRVLQNLINSSLNKQNVHARLKEALLKPIYKKNDILQTDNYRPISLINSFSKILEKCVASQIIDYLNSNELYYTKQFGFRAGHSTQHALLHYLNNIEKQLRNNKKCASVFLDLSKAFDCCSHEIIYSKLRGLGIDDSVINWFKSYLTNRKQACRIDDKLSEWFPVDIGVPQGSILGPLLFTLYINDMPSYVEYENLLSVLFADDTTFSITADNTQELETKGNQIMEKAYKWFLLNELNLNASKTRIICYNSEPIIKVNDTIISKISANNPDNSEKQHKFLGFHLNDQFNFDAHIDKVCNKLLKANFVLRKVKNQINAKQKTLIYNAIFKSNMEYGVGFWGQNENKTKKIVKLQKNALRYIYGASNKVHSKPLMRKYNILSFEDVVKINQLSIAHSVVYKKAPKAILSDLQMQNRNLVRPLRNNDLELKIDRSNKKSLCKFVIPDIWNKLEPEIQNIEKIHLFKNRIKTDFLEKYPLNMICNDNNCWTCNRT